MAINYDSMTEQERKEHFGLVIHRPENEFYKNSYSGKIDKDIYLSGAYGVVDVESDNQEDYTYADLMKYLRDYPEMLVPGWYKPYTEFQLDLIKIRTEYVNLDSKSIEKTLFETLKHRYTNDKLWEGWSDTPLINYHNTSLTCDEASTLYNQYVGDDEVKAQELLTLRTSAKNYIRQMVSEFLEEHAGKPDMPEFEREYVND